MKVASIATYRDRLDVLPDAINSLAPQVDIVQIYYNDTEGLNKEQFQEVHEEIYLNCEHSNVEIQCVTDQADLSKFLAIWEYPEATIYTCDDDLIYHKDYAYRLLHNLHYDHWIGADVVTLGGKIISDEKRFEKHQDYRTCFGQRIRCTNPPSDSRSDRDNFMFSVDIDVPLSGVSIFDASKFQDCKIESKYKYAADIQLAKWIKEKGLRCKRNWNHAIRLVTINKKMTGKDTIFDSHTSKRGKELYKLVADLRK